MQSSIQLQAQLMRDYYRNFSKYARGKKPDHPVAWVTAFTPVEILDALGIEYIYPESYAAVIAASNKEQAMLEESERLGLCGDCCAYSGCIEGCLSLQSGPRGVPPKPDVLIATNNQCNTLPGWWSLMSQEYQVPLIVIDYPGEARDREDALRYVTAQHEMLIRELEKLSGLSLDRQRLAELIENSKRSVEAWNAVVSLFPHHDVEPTVLFDGMSYLITARCKPETAMLYRAMAEEIRMMPEAVEDQIPLFWLGYPLWYHKKRYLSEILDGYRICGSNYITWWSLDYSGNTLEEQLFHAYNDTFLNLTPETKWKSLQDTIRESGAVGAISLKNKSCKCDFVSSRNIGLPQTEIEIDMIDRTYLNVERAQHQLEILREFLTIECATK